MPGIPLVWHQSILTARDMLKVYIIYTYIINKCNVYLLEELELK